MDIDVFANRSDSCTLESTNLLGIKHYESPMRIRIVILVSMLLEG